LNFDNFAYQMAISTDTSELEAQGGAMVRREVRSWMKQHCPDATIPASDSELLADILTSLMRHEYPLMTLETEPGGPQSPAEPGLYAMLSPRTRCYVKFPKRASTDLMGYAGLAWEIFKLLQGEPLDVYGASLAITSAAMGRIRFLSEPELKIVAFVVLRDKDSAKGIPTRELEEHWGSGDENLFRETLAGLVKRGVLAHTQGGYSLAA
jgi:hypothetical protein